MLKAFRHQQPSLSSPWIPIRAQTRCRVNLEYALRSGKWWDEECSYGEVEGLPQQGM